ncbi:transporter substrate-binding domain-containing protein [Kingella kingae]|nr:transporter substrate-binding domain-containing protein [Kingella kingae]EIC14233.1 hypothetical protein KKB_02055 [Kingella kingae PYKK081]MDK4525822.1 transporter substrate-binding domain-containing protein [Kingella kingae]MDK4528824.1 transporter substrate-binding domain-containing protein [Kingella kingae]MDK4530383.1 transporter substrate-binding domain-containing protein [Kingella kingae]MDK4531765.1 transporter substrate-binding domain-containing protein [Kingella kingae]
MDKDKPELLAKINAGLQNLKQSGQLEKIQQRWAQYQFK